MILTFIAFTIATLANLTSPLVPVNPRVLGQSQFSLEKRYANAWVNDVFKDNILLTLGRMDSSIDQSKTISWQEVTKPRSFSVTLNPGELFAFHEDVLDQYKGKPIKTMKSHFNYSDGFKSSGYLYGDGICHLASLLYRAAKNAGLDAYAPTNHDFAAIPEIPREFGVSIYFSPNQKEASERQNLYITNTKDKPIQFVFDNDGANLSVRIIEH
ncbi:MAG: VanW family protein [Patescibacteria group bacterium]